MSARRRTVGRIGLTRLELVTGVLVVALAVAALAVLAPSAAHRAGAPSASGPARLDDAALAAPRAAAALPPCPSAAPGVPPAGGPLAGIEVACLGAPGTVVPAAALAGREALLNVWASWCGPCRDELPALSTYARRADAVPVLGIDVRDRPAAALDLLARVGARLPVVADTDGALSGALRVVALPASFLLRADGSVVPVLPQEPFAGADEVAAAVDRTRRTGS